MAKLSDLKTLVDARAGPTTRAPRRATRKRDEAPRAAAGRTPPRPPAPAAKRAIAARKHADGDIDLAQAFADVQPLPAVDARRARAAAPRADPAAAHRRRPRCARRVEVRRRARAAAAGTSARSSRPSRRSCAAGWLRRAAQAAARPLVGAGRARPARPDDRRGARRARRFPARRAAARLALRAGDPRQGTHLAQPRAGAQGQGAQMAVALGRRARLLRGAAARGRRRRGAGPAARAVRGRRGHKGRGACSRPAAQVHRSSDHIVAVRERRQLRAHFGEPRRIDVADDDARPLGVLGDDLAPRVDSTECP